jgi:pimeloyl-ACP methyl ester carboxylesterase
LPAPLPQGCTVQRIAPDTASWRLRMLEALRGTVLPDARWSPPAAAAPSPGEEQQRYVDLLHGQVRVRSNGAGGLPVLLLHEVPGSSAELRPLAARLAADRLVIAPDLPGLGESHPLPYPSLGTYVSALGELLEALGIRTTDVVAHGLSTPFAIALAAHRPAQVRRLVLDAVPWIRARDRGRLLRHYCPPIQPDRHGAYLQHIWHQLRETQMSWPWFDRSAAAARRHDADLDPARLQATLVDVMKQLPAYGDAARAALGAAVREILPGVRQPVLLFNDPADVRYQGTARVRKRLTDVHALPRPATTAERAEMLSRFLD